MEDALERGMIRSELFVGTVGTVTAGSTLVNLGRSHEPTGDHFEGARYGRGEVGEYVLIEGQVPLLLGRIAEVRLREPERRGLRRDEAPAGGGGWHSFSDRCRRST